VTIVGIGGLLAWGLFVIGLIVAMAFGAFGLVAWADALHVCPDGNQCSDARDVMWLSAAAVVTAMAVSVVALRRALRSRRQLPGRRA
jgi:hypothetical protein